MISKKNPIDRLTIKGYISIRTLSEFKLNNLNILIGANGTGKSNFISYFKMLREIAEQRLQIWTTKQGGSSRLLHCGPKETRKIETKIRFGLCGYEFTLSPTVGESLVFSQQYCALFSALDSNELIQGLGIPGGPESNLELYMSDPVVGKYFNQVYPSILGWRIFHFHDTSETAGMKRLCSLHDNDYLRPDASNLAAYLHHLKKEHKDTYNQIRKTVALAIPFFDDFVLKPTQLESGEEQIRLLWRQKGSDYALWSSQLSDGSIRFICLVTALMLPDPPSTIIIDEPELGLHPYAIVLLGSLIRAASKRMQVIVSTQSVPLLNEFTIDDLIVVERKDGASTFKRLDEEEFKSWLEDYSVGELWEKNILGGRPGQ